MNRADLTAQLVKAMTENELLRHVRDACTHLKLRVYHTHDSRKSDKGWPDLAILGPRGLMLRELKRQNGRHTVDQVLWLEELARAGCDADTWRPSDWFSGRIVYELTELAKSSPDGPGRVNRAAFGRTAQDEGLVLDSGAGTDRAPSGDGPGTVGGAP